MEKVQFSNSPDTVSEPDTSAPVGSDAHIAPSADASAPVGSDAHIAPSQTTMEGIKS